MSSVKVLSATLLANHNTVQITDNVISNGSIFEIYVSEPDLVCNNIVVGGTTANITFDSKPTSNTPIKVLVNNIDGNFTVNASDVVSGTTNQDAINTSVSNSISTLSSGKVDTTTLNERVPSETVLGGVLYHGTTGNGWRVLTGANVNYDSNTTVNEKLDECFTSVSSGKSTIASAITDKGIPTLATDTFQTMANNISQISGGSTPINIITNGQISTTSAYVTPTLPTPFELNKRYVVKATLSGSLNETIYTLLRFTTTTGNAYLSFSSRSMSVCLRYNKVYSVTYTGSYVNTYLTINVLDIEDF